jgi:FtsZ-binding cell division protein ZapB
MAPCNAKTKLEKARALLSLKEPLANEDLNRQKLDTPSETKTWQEMLQALTGVDLTTCPNCGQGRLIR